MNKKEQKGQIILILIGFLLIITTYFYYPYMNKTKLIKNKLDQKKIEKSHEDIDTTFENDENIKCSTLCHILDKDELKNRVVFEINYESLYGEKYNITIGDR